MIGANHCDHNNGVPFICEDNMLLSLTIKDLVCETLHARLEMCCKNFFL